jgi:hypothetical protein
MRRSSKGAGAGIGPALNDPDFAFVMRDHDSVGVLSLPGSNERHHSGELGLLVNGSCSDANIGEE